MIDLLSRTGCGTVPPAASRPASPHPLPATTRPVSTPRRAALVVSGEIDLGSAPELGRLVVLHLRAAGELGVDLDLSHVRFSSAAWAPVAGVAPRT
jgi:hypothetical protein